MPGPRRQTLSESGQAKTASELVDRWLTRCVEVDLNAQPVTFPELYDSYEEYLNYLIEFDPQVEHMALSRKGLGMALHHRSARFRKSNGRRLYLGYRIKSSEEAFPD